MKHYHSKEDLGSTDVLYVVVQNGQKFKFQFTKVNNKYNGVDIFQGVKFWLNRCELVFSGKLVETECVIIWPYHGDKKCRVVNKHFHVYCDKEIYFEVGKTKEENPNLGIFNVWTADKKRCYEFGETSWINETVKDNIRVCSSKHSWEEGNSATLEFTIAPVPGFLTRHSK